MSSARLQEQSFAEGLERQLVKCALNPNVAEKIRVDPKRIAEFLGKGSTIFAKSYKSQNPFSGLLATGMAGYGQLRGVHQLRENFLRTVAALRESAAAHPEGSSARETIKDTIRKNLLAFRHERDKRLTEIGAVAAPREQFLHSTLPTTLGVGAGAYGGYSVGNALGNAQSQNDVSGAPVSSRLNYLFHPGNIPTSTPPGPANMGDQTQ